MTSPNLFEIAGRYTDVYEALFREANPSGAATIGAGAAAGFLKRSGLDNAVLAQVWDVADSGKVGALDKSGFFAALKLVSLSQAGEALSRDNLRLELPPPAIQGFVMGPPPTTANGASPSGDEWGITEAERGKYDAIFESLGPEAGKLAGERVRPVLLNSGLPQATLGRIWGLADIDQDGFLDRDEMCLALHLVYRALEGDAVPASLPPHLIPPSKRGQGFSRRGSTLSQDGGRRSRSGSVAAETGGFHSDGPQYEQHGYGHSTRSLTATPVPIQMGASGEVTTPSSSPARPPPPTSLPKAPTPPVWPVDVNKHAGLFTQLDTDADGMVSGGDIRSVLANSGLSQPILAHIWGLVDIRQSGSLNGEQFALIMHLIEAKLGGEEPPPSLPDSLLPPSLRPSRQSNGAATPGVENAQIAEVERELEEIRSEMRGLESGTVEVEAGMAIRQSEVKNLEVELSTLESTVRQLERQQGEAQRRLEALDAQRDALARTRDDLVGKLAADEAEIAATRGQLVASTATAAEKEAELNRKREELARLRDEENKMEVELQMEKANLDTQAQQHGSVEASIASVDANMRKIEASNQLMRETLDQLNALLADPASAQDNPLCLQPIQRPTLDTLIKAPGENRWAASGYQGDVFAHKPSAFASPATTATTAAAPASYYDAVPGDASTSADPFAASGGGGGGAEDPFAASAGGGAEADPFAGEDPFAGTNGGGGADPFGGGEDPFAGANGGGAAADPFGGGGDGGFAAPTEEAKEEKPKKPPPPRPAPPKGTRSGAATPTASTPDPFPPQADDPFAAQDSAPSSQSVGFADFGAF